MNTHANRPPLGDDPRLTTADRIEPLLSISGLCRVFDCDRRTIERMRSAGKLPRPDLTVGSRMPRWKPETVRAWIEQGGRA